MASLWPWLAVAGMGVLHGLNPATGWMFAAAWGLRSHDRAQVLRALWPIAVGHVASIAPVIVAVAFGLSMDRSLVQWLAGGLLVMVVLAHLSGHLPAMARAPAGHAGLALWSFMMSTAHGAGLMLVPALIPLCMGDASKGAIGDSLMVAFAAVAVHALAMLAATGLMAVGFGAGVGWLRRLMRHRDPRASAALSRFVVKSK